MIEILQGAPQQRQDRQFTVATKIKASARRAMLTRVVISKKFLPRMQAEEVQCSRTASTSTNAHVVMIASDASKDEATPAETVNR